MGYDGEPGEPGDLALCLLISGCGRTIQQ